MILKYGNVEVSTTCKQLVCAYVNLATQMMKMRKESVHFLHLVQMLFPTESDLLQCGRRAIIEQDCNLKLFLKSRKLRSVTPKTEFVNITLTEYNAPIHFFQSYKFWMCDLHSFSVQLPSVAFKVPDYTLILFDTESRYLDKIEHNLKLFLNNYQHMKD